MASRPPTPPEPRSRQPSRPRRPRANSEAARHRLARRAAETARDAALARLSAVQAREVERLAAEQLAVGGDPFGVGGATLPDLLVDGEVSRDAVEVAVAQLLDDRPGLRRPAPFPDLGQGRRSLGPAAGPDWAALLNGREE